MRKYFGADVSEVKLMICLHQLLPISGFSMQLLDAKKLSWEGILKSGVVLVAEIEKVHLPLGLIYKPVLLQHRC